MDVARIFDPEYVELEIKLLRLGNATASVDDAASQQKDRGDGLEETLSTTRIRGAIDAGMADLSEEWRLEFEERAAIMEYDGGMTCEQAEADALKDILRRMKYSEN